MSGGIITRKEEFKSPAVMAQEQQQADARSREELAKRKDPEQKGIEDVNNALSGAEGEKNEAEIERMKKYTEEDMKLAEELLFRGYAEKEYKVLDKTKITMASMTSAEVELVNEMVYEYANKGKDEKEEPSLSAKVVEGQQHMLLIALGFKGMNGTDISPAAGRTLSFIKSGIRRMSESEVDGDIKKFNEVRAELKKVIWARASELKRIPVSIIDVIAKRRFEFERLMYDITSREDLIPKS